MTRIYFKPQGCSIRNPRSRTWKPGERMQRKQITGNEELHDFVGRGVGGSNWRQQLDPDAIDQIADGLEKMVLSWSSDPLGQPPSRPTLSNSPTSPTLDSNSPFLTSGLLVGLSPAMTPAVEEMMRGELIKTCRPSVMNGCQSIMAGGQQSAEASFWYLTSTPSSLKKGVGNDKISSIKDCGDGSTGPSPMGGLDGPLENFKLQEPMHIMNDTTALTLHASQHSRRHNGWPSHSQRMDDEDSGSETGSIKERSSAFWSKECPGDFMEKVTTYHSMKSTRGHNLCNQSNESNEIHGDLSQDVTNHLHSECKLPCVPVNSLAHFQSLTKAKEESVEVYKKKVEEMQIALLECAMEYEVKIVEMKMQMLHIKSEHSQRDGAEQFGSQDNSQAGSDSTELTNCLQGKMDGQRVEYLRKQLTKLQREKVALARELSCLKKRERQFDLQKRNLEDALGRVNTLQRELAKREQEIVDCQLREKEVRAQLYDVQLALHKAQAAQIEPRKLLALLPALREWLQTIKKVPYDQNLMESRGGSGGGGGAPVDSIVCCVTREIQALQKALSRLAASKR
ncbi:hypothetical protein KP509_13G040300 [Ceratopteris richardii]|uniref:Uncharacterized protein n=1 Tax=Ceratopteris richardii TaxID=49495 RepID=A0A8T2TCY8_CERRI|nr:hypothetical protein KP509_13G040300 [Ceratopteris richardii]